MRAFTITGLLLALSACGPNKNSCNYRCQHDDACMQALAADGIAPYGMTQGDPGLCNGICSALRHSEREERAQAKQLGLANEPIPRHPCMPVPTN